MKLKLKTIFIMGMILVFSGCAGLSNKKALITTEPPCEIVRESFYFKLQDKSFRRYLTKVHLDDLPPDRQLEVVLLHELADVSDEKELARVFDSLWEEHEDIKKLVNGSDLIEGEREEYIYALVEIYYLLSAVPASSWHEKTAERLYQETLINLEPDQLSGYALHFYTLALLKNGKFDTAIPFLRRLEHFKPSSIYLKDLVIAMKYSMAVGADPATCWLMAMICQNSYKENLVFPDDELKVSIQSLQKAGKLELARKALLPVIQKKPQLLSYSFVKLLQQSDDTILTIDQIESNASSGEENLLLPEKRVSNKRWISNDSLTVENRKILVEVKVIKAGRHSNIIDPSLSEINENLRKTLNFSSFRLINSENIKLRVGEEGRIALPCEYLLVIYCKQITSEISQIKVSIINDDLEIFQTTVESIHGGITTIAGPHDGDEVILLRIKTFIIKTNAVRQRIQSTDEITQKIV